MKTTRKVLITLLLVGLVVGMWPVGGYGDVKKITDLFPLTLQIKDVTEIWRSKQPNEQYGVYDEGDKIIIIAWKLAPGSTGSNFLRDYYSVGHTDAGVVVWAFRDRPGIGTVEFGGIPIFTSEMIIPKSFFKGRLPTKASGYCYVGCDFGESMAPIDFNQDILDNLGLSPDSGCLWIWENKEFFFSPQANATIDQVANWLGLVYGTPTKEPSPLWRENQKATDKYSAELGYEYAGVVPAGTQYPKSYSAPDYHYFRMFIGLDRALWAGIVKPEEITGSSINRAEFALLLSRALKLPLGPGDLGRAPWDLKDPQLADYLPSIQAILDKGYMRLFPDGSFYPEGEMTREEVVKILYGIKNSAAIPISTTTPSHTQTILDFTIGSQQFLKNGQPFPLDTTPTIFQGRTLLPIRYVAESLGASVDWDQASQKVTITSTCPFIKLDKTQTTTTATVVELFVNSPTAWVNGQETLIDPSTPAVVPLILPPGRTMLPLRFIAETLGAKVEWIEETQEIVVTWEPPAPIKEKTLPPP